MRSHPKPRILHIFVIRMPATGRYVNRCHRRPHMMYVYFGRSTPPSPHVAPSHLRLSSLYNVPCAASEFCSSHITSSQPTNTLQHLHNSKDRSSSSTIGSDQPPCHLQPTASESHLHFKPQRKIIQYATHSRPPLPILRRRPLPRRLLLRPITTLLSHRERPRYGRSARERI